MDMSRWLASLRESFSELALAAAAYVPRLATALLLVVIGWLIARLLRVVARKTVGRVELLLRRGTGTEETREQKIAAKMVSDVVFWFVLLFFIAAGTRQLGLPVVTEALSKAASYLPSVLGAVLILLAAFVLAEFVRRAVLSAAAASGLGYSELLGQVARGIVLAVACVLALNQLHVDSTILVILFAILLGTLLGGAMLAFGLGARDTVRNILAAHYLAQNYRAGQTIRVQDVTGRIIDIKSSGVVLDTAEGQVVLPASLVTDSISLLVSEPN